MTEVVLTFKVNVEVLCKTSIVNSNIYVKIHVHLFEEYQVLKFLSLSIFLKVLLLSKFEVLCNTKEVREASHTNILKCTKLKFSHLVNFNKVTKDGSRPYTFQNTKSYK